MKHFTLVLALMLFPVTAFAGEKIKSTDFFVVDQESWETGADTGIFTGAIATEDSGVVQEDSQTGSLRIEYKLELLQGLVRDEFVSQDCFMWG